MILSQIRDREGREVGLECRDAWKAQDITFNLWLSYFFGQRSSSVSLTLDSHSVGSRYGIVPRAHCHHQSHSQVTESLQCYPGNCITFTHLNLWDHWLFHTELRVLVRDGLETKDWQMRFAGPVWEYISLMFLLEAESSSQQLTLKVGAFLGSLQFELITGNSINAVAWFLQAVMIGSICRWHFSQGNEDAACSLCLCPSHVPQGLRSEGFFTWGFIALCSNEYLGQASANKTERFFCLFVSQLLR